MKPALLIALIACAGCDNSSVMISAGYEQRVIVVTNISISISNQIIWIKPAPATNQPVLEDQTK